MYKFCFKLCVLLCVYIPSFCQQVLPKQGDTLNYRLSGFQVPRRSHVDKYIFEIAHGRPESDKEFQKSRIISDTQANNRAVYTLPSFGADYAWQVSYLKKGRKKVRRGELCYFSVGNVRYVDTSKFRLRIIDSARNHKPLLLLTDSRVLYDTKGAPVWFLPSIPGILDDSSVVRDLKPTSQYTFTFLYNNGAYEVDYNGRLLWSAPAHSVSKSKPEQYHHEFTRLSNGNYMVAGMEDIALNNSGPIGVNVSIGTLTEFDTTGKMLWHWKASSYFKQVAANNPNDTRLAKPTHMNSFYFDQARNFIYVSFRDANTILKVSYPSGKILADYNESDTPSLFQGQHHCSVGKNGELNLYNNNFTPKGHIDGKSVSTLLKLTESKQNTGKLQSVWSFHCNIDSMARSGNLAGGSLYELSDGDMLACMGTSARIFLVSPAKELLWNGMTEIRSDGRWLPMQQYRTSCIETQDALNPFIFR